MTVATYFSYSLELIRCASFRERGPGAAPLARSGISPASSFLAPQAAEKTLHMALTRTQISELGSFVKVIVREWLEHYDKAESAFDAPFPNGTPVGQH